MSSSLGAGASSGARQTSGAAVTDQYRQQVVMRMMIVMIIVMIVVLQVLAGTEILSRTGESLSRAQQVAIETDEVGQFSIFINIHLYSKLNNSPLSLDHSVIKACGHLIQIAT